MKFIADAVGHSRSPDYSRSNDEYRKRSAISATNNVRLGYLKSRGEVYSHVLFSLIFSFSKILTKGIAKVEMLLKTVMIPHDPADGLVDRYLMMFADDISVSGFQKILDLKVKA